MIRDETPDLAVLRLADGVAAAPLVLRSDPARLAQPVHALGFPLAGLLLPHVTVTSGTVNTRTGAVDGDGHLQIPAPIQPGNSGGPVIGDGGRVVGVVVATLWEAVDERSQNVNFATPADAVARYDRLGAPVAAPGIEFGRR